MTNKNADDHPRMASEAQRAATEGTEGCQDMSTPATNRLPAGQPSSSLVDAEFETWLEAYGKEYEYREAFANGLAELSPDLETPFRRFAGLVCKVTCHDFFTLNYPPLLRRKCLRCGFIQETNSFN